LETDNIGTRLVTEYESLRRREHELIMKLLDVLPKIDNLGEERVTQVRDALFHADNPFLIMFVGPFSSGKSSLINALLSEENLLPVGVVPTTDRITILRAGDTAQRVRSGEYDTLFHPSPILKRISFVDTPGLESVFQQHEETTRKFLHRADLVLLVMLSTQAMTAHNLEYMKLLQEYGKTIILVINQADLLSYEESKSVRDYVLEQSQSQLGFKPEVWMMSARQGQTARAAESEMDRRELWHASGLHKIEEYVDRQLGDVARLRQKLRTPLQIVQNVNQLALEAVRTNQSAMDHYQSIGQNIDQQLAAQKREQDRAIRDTVEAVNSRFAQAAQRGGDAIRDMFKLSNALSSFLRGLAELLGLGNIARRMQGGYVKAAFESFKAFEPIDELPQVTDKLPPRLEGKDVQDIEDLVKYSRHEIDALPDGIRSKVIGNVQPPMQYDRTPFQEIRPTLADIEDQARQLEPNRLEQVVRNTLLYLGAWELLVIVLAIFFITGGGLFSEEQETLRLGLFFAALGCALLGLLILPIRGRMLANNHASGLLKLQSRYVDTVSKAADKQMTYGMQLRRDSVAPLMRLVEAQTGIQTDQLRSLQETQQEIVKIEGELSNMGKPALFGMRG
jgi:small GTP-binding protein